MTPLEQEFKQWYLQDGLTTYQIADKCEVSRRSVFRWMKKWGIKAIPRKRCFEHLKQWSLTDRQKELLVGTMLGDACLGKHGWHHRLHISHCEQQKGLVDWLWQEFKPLTNSPPKRGEDLRGNSVMWGFSTITHQDFDFYDVLFYDQEKFKPDGSKIKLIRPEIEDMITPLSLAVWFMDDGSAGKNSTISTHSFTYEENQLLQKILLNKFNIEAKIRHNEKYCWLGINKENTQNLGKLINNSLVPCMEYKTL